jgi:hypothetical protein
MTYAVTLGLLALFGLGAPVLVWWYVQRLPFAPDCPSCRAVTRQASEGVVLTRWILGAATTVVRECTSCGWHGRMRWRWAPTRSR